MVLSFHKKLNRTKKEQQRMKAINQMKVLSLINSTKGKFVGITFTKKDGSVRKLTGRTGVKKGVKGIVGRTPAANDTNSYKIMWDSRVMEFRMVNLATISEIRFAKETYIVVR
jgi:phage/plasmid primase-like uncharacterized protein